MSNESKIIECRHNHKQKCRAFSPKVVCCLFVIVRHCGTFMLFLNVSKANVTQSTWVCACFRRDGVDAHRSICVNVCEPANLSLWSVWRLSNPYIIAKTEQPVSFVSDNRSKQQAIPLQATNYKQLRKLHTRTTQSWFYLAVKQFWSCSIIANFSTKKNLAEKNQRKKSWNKKPFFVIPVERESVNKQVHTKNLNVLVFQRNI